MRAHRPHHGRLREPLPGEEMSAHRHGVVSSHRHRLRVGSPRGSSRSPAGRWGDAKSGGRAPSCTPAGVLGTPGRRRAGGCSPRAAGMRALEETLRCWRWRDGGSCAGSESF